MEKLNSIQNKGQWLSIATSLNENFSKIEQEIEGLNSKSPSSDGDVVDLSEYLKKDGDASQLKIGESSLSNLIDNKISNVFYFDMIVDSVSSLKQATTGASNYYVAYISNLKRFAARVGDDYFAGWYFLGSPAEHNKNNIARTDCLYIDRDGAIYRFINNSLQKFSKGEKKHTNNPQVNMAIKELYVEGYGDLNPYLLAISKIVRKKSGLNGSFYYSQIQLENTSTREIVAEYYVTDDLDSVFVRGTQANSSGISFTAVVDWKEIPEECVWFEGQAYITSKATDLYFNPAIFAVI